MLSDNIRKYRKEREMTQQELADRLHIVRQTVSKWEKNLSVPDACLLKKLSSELSVSVADLLGEAENELSDDGISIKLSEINDALSLEIKKRRKTLRIIAPIIVFLILFSVCAVGLYASFLNPSIRYSISKPVYSSAENGIEKVHLVWHTRFGLPLPDDIKDEIAVFGANAEKMLDEIHNEFTAPIHITADVYYRGNTTVFIFSGTGIKEGKQTDYYRELIFHRKIKPVK